MRNIPIIDIAKAKILHTGIQMLSSMKFLNFKYVQNKRPYYEQREMRSLWREYKPNGDDNRILIYGLRTYTHYDLAVFEKVLTDTLLFNGANVMNLICSGFLETCDGVSCDESHAKVCARCTAQRKTSKKIYPSIYIEMSNYIKASEITQIQELLDKTPDDKLAEFNYLGVKVGYHGLTSTNKYFRNGLIDSKDPNYLKILKHHVKQGMYLVQIAKNILEIEKPTHFITLHGGYSSWGPITDYLGDHGVSIYLHNKSFNLVGYFYITKGGEALADIVAKEEWMHIKNEPLMKHQQEKLKAHLESVKQGKTTEYKLYYEKKTSTTDDNVVKMLDTVHGNKFVLYPHNFWDKAFLNRYDELGGNLFVEDVEWMMKTVEFFIRHPELTLFVKPHPGENMVADFTKFGALELIRDHFKELPSNIVLIPRTHPITSFNLMDKGCVGIVYTSTSGLEHSYFKKPVIVAGEVHYVRAGAAFKIRNIDEYWNLLLETRPLYEFITNEYDTIERYAYYYYFRQQVKIPFYRPDIWLGDCIDWNPLKNYKEFVEQNKEMNHVARSIISKKHVLSID